VRGANQTVGETARIKVTPGRAGQLHRLARSVETVGDDEVITIEFRDIDRLAGLIAAAGKDAVALEPPELRKSTMALLAAAAGGKG